MSLHHPHGSRWPARHPALAGGLIALAVLLVSGSWLWVLAIGALLVAVGLLREGAAWRAAAPSRSSPPGVESWWAGPASAAPIAAGPRSATVVVETGGVTVWVVQPEAVVPRSPVVEASTAPRLVAPLGGELAEGRAERVDRRRLPARASGWG